LIDAGHLSLPEVAAAAGFADQSQMTKIFQKMIGTTPGRLRRLGARPPASSSR